MRQMDAWGKGYSEQGEQEVDWLISLGGRWTFWIWYHLLSGPKRFGELQKLLSPISQHMLILKLRELERMGVLARHASVPKSLKVEYTLTQLGQNTEPLLHQIYAWGRWACDQLGLAYDGPVMDEGVEYAHHA